jgi:hypothetical protein
MSLYLGNLIGDTNSLTLHRDLRKNDLYQTLARETRPESICNTKQNIPQVDNTYNKWFNYKRSGAYKYADPMPNISRPQQWNWDGRKVAMLNTLDYNSKPNFPDVITAYPQEIVGQY